MYEYKVLIVNVKECEEKLNQFAKDGWRLAEMVWNRGGNGISVVAAMEREVKEN